MKDLVRRVKGGKKSPPTAGKVVPDKGVELSASLLQKIEELYESTNGEAWKQSDSFAPSSSNQCPRYMVYRFRGFSQTISHSGQTKRIFEFGNIVESILEDTFLKLGIVLDSQVPVKRENPPIKGYIDFVIDFGGPKVVECKSINDAGFMYRRTSNKPTDGHYRQIQMYFHATGYTDGFIIYINKNTSEILVIYVQKDDKFIEKIIKKYDKIYKAHLDGKLPERPYKQNSKNCNYCDAKTWCWQDSEVGVDIGKKDLST